MWKEIGAVILITAMALGGIVGMAIATPASGYDILGNYYPDGDPTLMHGSPKEQYANQHPLVNTYNKDCSGEYEVVWTAAGWAPKDPNTWLMSFPE